MRHGSSVVLRWEQGGCSTVWCCLALLCAALLLLACSQEEQGRAQGSRQERLRVEVVRAAEPPDHRVVIFSGAAASAETHPLSFRTSGKIEAIAVDVGEAMKPGDLIAELDRTEHRLEVQRQEAVVDRAKAALDRASRDYERMQKLFEVDNVSPSRLDEARSAYLSARSRLKEARQGLMLAKERLGYCRLQSRLRGEVTDVLAAEEETVAAGFPVVLLSRTDAMEMEVFVPEPLVYRIQVGDRAEAAFGSLPGRSFPARIKEVGVEPGPTTTYPVRLSLLRTDPDLRPGMVGEVRFVFPLEEAAALIPPGAVTGGFSRQGRIWVLDPESGRVHPRRVELGDLLDEGLLIRSNLRPGERIVLRGAHRLREGQRVRAITER